MNVRECSVKYVRITILPAEEEGETPFNGTAGQARGCLYQISTGGGAECMPSSVEIARMGLDRREWYCTDTLV